MKHTKDEAQPVQDLPFGVGGGLVAIKTLLSRDPCVHANTAIEMIGAILKEHPAAPVQETPFQIGQRLRQEGKGISDLWGAVSSDADMPEAQRGFESATPPAAPVQPVAQDAQEKCRIEDVPAKGGLVPTPPAQPAPVQQKPLFADIIAKHPGLAGQLEAMDAAPAAPTVQPVETWEDLHNALQRIDTAAVGLPTFQVRHEGGLDAVVQNIVDAIVALHEDRTTPPAQPAPVQEPEHIVHSNGRYSPLLTRMMNKRVESNVKQVIHLYDKPPAAPTVQEPVYREYQTLDGVWHMFANDEHYKNTSKNGQHPWPVRELYTGPAAPVPLTDVYAQFNAAINFAIEQRTEAAVFLRAWREGDTSEWPEFDAHGITKGQS